MKVVSIFICFSVSILLSSCAATSVINSKPAGSFYDSNGKQTQVATCSTFRRKACNKKAGNICKSRGYKVRDTRKEAFSYTFKLYFQCN